jgi:hypothetical protein
MLRQVHAGKEADAKRREDEETFFFIFTSCYLFGNERKHNKTLNESRCKDMREKVVEARESLYLLSIELVILYVVAFGLLSLKTDNMFSVGMAYYAVLYTFMLAYVLPVLGLLFSAIGSRSGERTAMAAARGASVFVVVAFWLLVVLIASLWSSPVICVYETDMKALCHTKGDAIAQHVHTADVRFMFPSRAQYMEYGDLANATYADVFLKTSLSENEYVAKLHAVVALAFAFVILVVQMSFFFAVCCLEDENEGEVFSASDLLSLFTRCALLLLCIVIDTTDFIGEWNIVDIGPQMLPSLAFTSLLILFDFSNTILENTMQTWTTPSTLRVLIHLAETVASLIYVLFAALVACHYVVGGFVLLRDFITDTRWTIVHVLFIVFIILDAFLALVRCLHKLVKHVAQKKKARKEAGPAHTIVTKFVEQDDAKAFHVDEGSMKLLTLSKKNR